MNVRETEPDRKKMMVRPTKTLIISEVISTTYCGCKSFILANLNAAFQNQASLLLCIIESCKKDLRLYISRHCVCKAPTKFQNQTNLFKTKITQTDINRTSTGMEHRWSTQTLDNYLYSYKNLNKNSYFYSYKTLKKSGSYLYN